MNDSRIPDSVTLLRALRARAQQATELLLADVEREGRTNSRPLLEQPSDFELYERLTASVLRQIVRYFAEARGLWCAASGVCRGRLFQQERFGLPDAHRTEAEGAVRELLSSVEVAGALHPVPYADLGVEVVGWLYEMSLATTVVARDGKRKLAPSPLRRSSGSFFTPARLTEQVVARALECLRTRVNREPFPRPLHALRICDPALGSGAFLLEACRQLAAEREPLEQAKSPAERRTAALRNVASQCIAGVDLSPLAVAVAEVSLWLLVADPTLSAADIGRSLRVGDALSDFDWSREFQELCAGRNGFDLLVGNPPWVAYAGRAAQPLEPRKRAYYREAFSVFRGYPTLHGLFIEQATRLAPRGVIALVIPSPVADLDGYRPVRRALSLRHRVCEPLLEFGQDAFAQVTQPCFALIAEADADADGSDRPWLLSERQRKSSLAEQVDAPACFEQLEELPRLPRELFGEMGFQSTRRVSEALLLRAPEPHGRFQYPLLEGRDIVEFRQREPRLFLCADPDELKRAGCRARAELDYTRVGFVVRQTAKVTIAALHRGYPFRNSLLAGFAHQAYSSELVVALLNSALYRALHLGRQRDARQAAFPQVKIRHLRALPAPPSDLRLVPRLEAVTRAATEQGMTRELRGELDDVVFELFAVGREQRKQVLEFLGKRAPELGHGPLNAK